MRKASLQQAEMITGSVDREVLDSCQALLSHRLVTLTSFHRLGVVLMLARIEERV